MDKLLAMIDEKGRCTIPLKQAMRLLELLINKLKLVKFSPSSEKKLINFLENAYIAL